MKNFDVFYSFHYDDVGSFKANIVRNSARLKCYHGLLTDQSIWEGFKAKTDAQIKKRIDNSKLIQSDATIVLIGQNTHERRWVKYEIIKSFEAGNTLIGIHINRIKGKDGITRKGLNPFDRLSFEYDEKQDRLFFYELISGIWQPFRDLPFIENKKGNSVYIKERTLWQWLTGKNKHGSKYRLSEFVKDYTWKIGEHNAEDLHNWIKDAHEWIKI